MKKLFISLISIYQAAFPIRGYCRYYPTCSEYTKIVIGEYGIIKGSGLALLRILSCQPFYKSEYQSNKLEINSKPKNINVQKVSDFNIRVSNFSL